VFALLALLAFVLSPFIPSLGPWPLVTLGLALIAVHFLWPWTPWSRRAP
jgi:hypothetical protein